MPIPVDSYRLPNGLLVTLSEDHSAPIVAVNLWYHVGSANERAGRTGFAHLFEHMLFQGSEHVGVERTFRIYSARGRHAQRLHLARSHELFRDRAVESACGRTLARGRPHGRAASRDDAAEARHAARRRDERTALVGGQSAVRHVVGAASGARVSAVTSVSSFADRIVRRSCRGESRRHRAVFPDILHAGQCRAHDRG